MPVFPTDTNLFINPNPSVFGQTVTYSAVVVTAPVFGQPTGAVNFLNGSESLGIAALDANSTATLSLNTLSTGSSIITAIYAGDSNFQGSVSTSVAQTVMQASITTTVTSSLNPSVISQSVTFTATVVPVPSGIGTPTGTVTFMNGVTPLGTSTLNGSGTATLTTNELFVGTHSITATYSGESIFQGSTSPVLTQVVNPASTTTTITSSPNPSVTGQNVTFVATVEAVSLGPVTPTGTITFMDGGTVIGIVPIDANGMATLTTSFLTIGSHTIQAIYTPTSDFQESSSSLIQVVNPNGAFDQTTCFLSDANGNPVDPLAEGAIICKELTDGDKRQDVPVILPNGQNVTLQKVTMKAMGYIVVRVVEQHIVYVTPSIPFHIVETFLLCAPPETNIHCRLVEFDCNIQQLRDYNNDIYKILVVLSLCQSIKAEANVNLLIEGKICEPRGRAVPESTTVRESNHAIEHCLQVNKIFDWITSSVEKTIEIPIDK